MPIVDVELVCSAPADADAVHVQALADALGAVFGAGPGSTWVRLRSLPATAYAENLTALAAGEEPVFVTVLHAKRPAAAALDEEVAAITDTVARCVSRPPGRVHVQYAPAGAGRQAFGGRLLVAARVRPGK